MPLVSGTTGHENRRVLGPLTLRLSKHVLSHAEGGERRSSHPGLDVRSCFEGLSMSGDKLVDRPREAYFRSNDMSPSLNEVLLRGLTSRLRPCGAVLTLF